MRLKLIPPDEARLLRKLQPAKKKTMDELRREAKQAFQHHQESQQEVILDEWPAQEFSRVIHDVTPVSYSELWEKSGVKFFEGGRMIALKNDPIWVKISQFGLPYPPFDEYNVMWTQEVDRSEAERLGLVSRKQKVQPQIRNWEEDKKQILL